MVEQYLGARPPIPPNAPKESFVIKMVWLRERLQHFPPDANADTLRQYARRIPHAGQVRQLGAHSMAPVAEKLPHMCATVVGECCICLDVQITMQCFKEEDYGYCRMCSANIVVDLPQIFRLVPT
ncbi:hypothetical protein PIB30_009573 [Stylosanthes scabra]|uniref:Uncharacterized protein n=1 Tax=Stylosanthes scabra TaxID=79078 RepID=A0ABU6Q566_9FABA|nr:hypothetical protein [Stylosanthes scabra]